MPRLAAAEGLHESAGDVGQRVGLLGLAFYPGYATNRYFHLFSTLSITTTQGSGRLQVISRFLATANNANVALTNPFNRWAASD